MDTIKYKNEPQFLDDFSAALKKSLINYKIENNKSVGLKELDMFIENQENDQTYTVEVKGSPDQGPLPPEIIPWLEDLKNKIERPEKNHFIVLSLSNVNENTKSLFKEKGLEIFEYEKHRDNLTNDFVSFMNDLESK
jgi:hypothetical protein